MFRGGGFASEDGDMAKLPVVDERERDRIRLKLQAYQDRHGSIGVPELFQRMLYMLDGLDRTYIDQRSLQRFMAGTNRTSNEKVIRYRKFLELVAEPSVAEQIATILDHSIDLPPHVRRSLDKIAAKRDPEITRKRRTAPPHLTRYAGRYDYFVSPRDKLQELSRELLGYQQLCELRPTNNPKFLEFFKQSSSGHSKSKEAPNNMSSGGVLMWFGPGTYLLLQSSRSGGIVGLLRETDDDPVTLEGSLLVSSARDIAPMNVRSISLRRVGELQPEEKPD